MHTYEIKLNTYLNGSLTATHSRTGGSRLPIHLPAVAQ